MAGNGQGRPELCPITNLCLAIRDGLKKGKVWKSIRSRWKDFSFMEDSTENHTDQVMTITVAPNITLLLG
jgi:hypothetical protein